MKRKFFGTILLASSLLVGTTSALLSCGEDNQQNQDVKVTSITLSLSASTVLKGKTVTATVAFNPANATKKTYKLESSDTSIASIVDNTITGLKAGKVKITAISDDGSKKSEADLEVTEPNTTLVEKIEMQLPATSDGNVEITPTLTFTPSTALNKNVTYTSSNEDVVKVITDGGVQHLITGKEGESDITVTTEDGAKTATGKAKVVYSTDNKFSLTQNDLNDEFFNYLGWYTNTAIAGTSETKTTVYSFNVKSNAVDGSGYTFKFRDDNNGDESDTSSRMFYNLEYSWGKFYFKKKNPKASVCDFWLGEIAAPVIYKVNEVNRIDLVMKDEFDASGKDTKMTLSLYVNGLRLQLNAKEGNDLEGISFSEGNLIDTNPSTGPNLCATNKWGDGTTYEVTKIS